MCEDKKWDVGVGGVTGVCDPTTTKLGRKNETEGDHDSNPLVMTESNSDGGRAGQSMSLARMSNYLNSSTEKRANVEFY